ncbi:DUF2628 domain-containing protein [Uliginosibacterium sp. 31-16]|uniref:DUF2628 domain-containing protein n=1 Tax=Uliginosibacterium sp. 31-16 TaxID=3068315 RepID=UPI00273D6F36|nr:DUF2628 domain-containing protein [Uliginosibacterium sp. 31-16]MDP5238681.1 DUF2628 domain-containing protein [Uliginosibacterium sp. 31-16]
MDSTNPYQPPKAELDGSTPQSEALNGDQALETFIGKKYAYYTRKWEEAQRKGSIQSWNLSAFFLGFAWMAYRKMYKYCGIFIAAISVETVLEMMLNLPQAISSGVNIGLAVCFGMFGNHLYKLHVEQKIREISAHGSPAQINAELARQGGTSVGAAIGFAVLLLAVILGLMMLIGDF